MKLPFTNLFALAAATVGSAVASGFAQDTTPPVVAVPIGNVTVSAGAAPTVINLKKTFNLQGVTGKVVRFTTTLGNMDIELDAADYPLNVANFLNYVNSGAYNNTFIHRGISNFIVQGGGYTVAAPLNFPHIPVNAAVKGEHKGPNARGTIAFALTAGSNSADTGTSEWFFNLVDNTPLDAFGNNQGPFTAFGRVIENGLATMDAIGKVPTYDASGIVTPMSSAGAMTNLPLINYQSSQGNAITPDLVYITQAAQVPLTPKAQGDTALLALNAKVRSTSNPNLVTATLNARKLTLTYTPGQTGTAVIRVRATDAAGSKVVTKFNVTVQ